MTPTQPSQAVETAIACFEEIIAQDDQHACTARVGLAALRAELARPEVAATRYGDRCDCGRAYASCRICIEQMPRHKFWGAGEPDCPQDIKASNGELHTMRCKVCGDGWRKSTDICFAAIASQRVPVALPQEPDMRAICEALGFDPTNHHNAAKCPYCRPEAPAPKGDAKDAVFIHWTSDAGYLELWLSEHDEMGHVYPLAGPLRCPPEFAAILASKGGAAGEGK